jgi:protein-disulfide isomerase
MNYVRIDLPLFEHHEWAIPAAMGARALQKVAPNKYWAYVDYVFKNQELIGKRKIDEVVREWMEDNDVDWNAIAKVYNSKSERQALLDQVSRAFAVGVAATPTFVVNGQILGFGGGHVHDGCDSQCCWHPVPRRKSLPSSARTAQTGLRVSKSQSLKECPCRAL